MQLFDYIFNVGGNYTATINGMTEATGDFSAKVESANNWVGKLSSTLAVVDLATSTDEVPNCLDVSGQFLQASFYIYFWSYACLG